MRGRLHDWKDTRTVLFAISRICQSSGQSREILCPSVIVIHVLCCRRIYMFASSRRCRSQVASVRVLIVDSNGN